MQKTNLLAVAAALVFAARALAAPPQPVDLNAFDAGKKTMALPDGEVLAYVDMGKRSGPAVVLIHGYTDNARDWVPMLPYVSARYRLILVDIRGHGQSSKPECCYGRLDFAYDIKLLLDALGVQRADIVGHSFHPKIIPVRLRYSTDLECGETTNRNGEL